MFSLIVFLKHFSGLLQTVGEELQLLVEDGAVVLNRVHRRKTVRVHSLLTHFDDVDVLQFSVL